MASSHETFFSVSECTYDVFLSFRGTDTRKSFTDHLYTALSDNGIHTFRDNDEIERGENINLALEKAIKMSRISIIVFSKDYVSSKACRYEVETILEHSKKSKHLILPVFYDVDPSEVKKQAEGLVADKGQDEQMNNVKRSSAALKEVVNLVGMVLKNQADGHEAKFIQEVVQWVKDKTTWQVVSVPTHLVGMEFRVNKIDLWLKNCSARAGKLVIWGMGGIGKTVIAKVLYNRHYGTFNGSSFLENIRQVSKNSNSVLHLQRQLLSNLQNKREHKVHDVYDGHRRLKFVLSRKRVLLVLDDVENENQIKAILGQERDLLRQGSKIIITTRKEGLLKRSEIDITHEIKTLSDIESLELFSWHAFGHKHPVDGYTEHAKRFLRHCNGLPLALEVLGSSVREQSLAIWESKLKKLEAIPDSEIVEKLRISYDDLDWHDRKLFLDIAFFFVGKKKTDMFITLDRSDCFVVAGIQNLIERNLLKIENGKLSMHPLLQSMGKAIVDEESTHPQERSRLWRHDESFNILRDKIGTEKIEGLILDRFERLKEDDFAITDSRNSSESDLEVSTFERMLNLRLLKLNYVQFSKNDGLFPRSLRFLYWRGSCLRFLPSGLPLNNLAALDMRNSKLEQLWTGAIKVLGQLKILNLSHSHYLNKTPDFTKTPNLQKLILKDCKRLVGIDESILNLQKLCLLNLRGCIGLRALPRNISKVTSLQEIDISDCSNLILSADEFKKMESLTVLRVDRIDINKALGVTNEIVPVGNGFVWPFVRKPMKNPHTLWTSFPSSLVSLSLGNCNLTDDAFGTDFGRLNMLESLSLVGNQICRLPDCVGNLSRLQRLDLSWCQKLEKIQWPAIVLEELNVTECKSLQQITYDTDARPLRIQHGACVRLCYVQYGFKTKPVKEVDVRLINNVGFFSLDYMADVEVMITNCIVWSRVKRPVEILWECGLFSTYFPGREVPCWFMYKTKGPTITLNVPSNHQIRGLNVCVVYTLSDIVTWHLDPIKVEVFNKTKHFVCPYRPRCYGVPEAYGYIVWLCHLGVWFPFEEGDEVEVSFEMKVEGQIKGCGAHLLYYDEVEEKKQYFNTLLCCWDSNFQLGLEEWKEEEEVENEEEKEAEEEDEEQEKEATETEVKGEAATTDAKEEEEEEKKKELVLNAEWKEEEEVEKEEEYEEKEEEDEEQLKEEATKSRRGSSCNATDAEHEQEEEKRA